MCYVVEHLLIVELRLEMSTAEILERMRVMKLAREQRSHENIVCCILGFDDDSRELYEIPEVQTFCRNVASAGFISYLDYSTTFNPKTSDLIQQFWGAAEFWLCAEARLKPSLLLSESLLRELHEAIAESNGIADAAIGPMASDDLAFDYTALDNLGFKEDAVREDIIAPFLRKAGFRATGVLRMERSKSLVHPFVMIGSKKHKIRLVPDYTLYENDDPLLVLEAKAPGESVINSQHVEQTYSYAIHPDVRCTHFALCNGRQLAIYHISERTPLFVIDCKEIRHRWSEVEKYLLPKYLKRPELRKFQPDFGMIVKQMGVTDREEMLFTGMLPQNLCKSSEALFVANCSCSVGSVDCLVSFDFGCEILETILIGLPHPQADQIRIALASMPYSIDLDAKVRVNWTAHLGDVVEGRDEQFIPMVVDTVNQVDYDGSRTIGIMDPEAARAGVKRLLA